MNKTSAAVARYILKARTEFVRGTGHASPEEVVAHGVKTVADWCEALAQARTTVKTGYLEGNRVPAWERGPQEAP